ncbi:MAG: hypothetical protein OXQ86_06055 [Gammaproteobacteria bacterium]|nr:hypothetical protein [Gammaproteobacteria bacterium]MDE0413662.1 hypothetical protein [Gammaproteobacteria bacterium]
MLAGFVAFCVVLALAALACVAPQLWRDRGKPASTAALTASCLLIPVLAVLIYLQSSNYEWAHAGLEMGEDGSPPRVEELIGPLRARLEASPDDPRGWMLLGASYAQVERYSDAAQAFDRVLDLTGGRDMDALMGKAEALILGNPQRLLEDAGEMVEQVLLADPANPKGLWYGGLRASATGQDIIAVQRWRMMLEGPVTPEVRAIVEGELNRLGASVESGGAVSAEGSVELRLTLGLPATPPPGAVLFIVARIPGQAGPPLAAKRVDGARFPLEVRLSDADAMLPGATISDQSELAITARLSASGQTTRGAGDYEAEAAWQAGQGALELELIHQP